MHVLTIDLFVLCLCGVCGCLSAGRGRAVSRDFCARAIDRARERRVARVRVVRAPARRLHGAATYIHATTCVLYQTPAPLIHVLIFLYGTQAPVRSVRYRTRSVATGCGHPSPLCSAPRCLVNPASSCSPMAPPRRRPPAPSPDRAYAVAAGGHPSSNGSYASSLARSTTSTISSSPAGCRVSSCSIRTCGEVCGEGAERVRRGAEGCRGGAASGCSAPAT